MDRALRDHNIPLEDAIKEGVFAIWGRSAQVRPVFEYARETHATDRPLEMAGFDHQFSAGRDATWPAAVERFLDAADPAILPADLRGELREGMERETEADEPSPEGLRKLAERWRSLAPLIEANRDRLVGVHGEAEIEFMLRTVEDAAITMEGTAAYHEGGIRAPKDVNARDRRMGENIVWLARERYPDRKIIVWAATFHAVHDVQGITDPSGGIDYAGTVTCGQVAKEALGDDLYTVGFIAGDGRAANVFRPQAFHLPPPPAGSLDALCLETGKPFLFVDFRPLPADHWARARLVARPLGYAPLEADWTRQVDAMFYTRVMFPSTPMPQPDAPLR
jgi:erythromycin esterase